MLFVGDDWAEDHHDVEIVDEHGKVLASRRFPEGLAVLVAIKGVGRFTELEEAEARERFIIGTLTSIIWACACAAVFRIVAG